jgi:hypothetical protein
MLLGESVVDAPPHLLVLGELGVHEEGDADIASVSADSLGDIRSCRRTILGQVGLDFYGEKRGAASFPSGKNAVDHTCFPKIACRAGGGEVRFVTRTTNGYGDPVVDMQNDVRCGLATVLAGEVIPTKYFPAKSIPTIHVVHKPNYTTHLGAIEGNTTHRQDG